MTERRAWDHAEEDDNTWIGELLDEDAAARAGRTDVAIDRTTRTGSSAWTPYPIRGGSTPPCSRGPAAR